MNENIADQNELKSRGVLTPKGEISQDKINLISGAMAAPLFEALWAFSGCEAGALNRVSVIFTQMYSKGMEMEMMAILRILYDVSGLQFPEDVKLLETHSAARKYFLFSFLLDMDDWMQDCMEEAIGE
jgi:hypothetical protein